MDTSELISQAQALRQRIQPYAKDGPGVGPLADAAQAQVCEFLTRYSGVSSAFAKHATSATGHNSYRVQALSAILDSFVEYLRAGLAIGLSPERKAQLDVVSDFLDQAQVILDEAEYHPAVAAVLIGACLEEFLRTWTEAAGVAPEGPQLGIDAYCKALRAAELLTKQDTKDITAWAGIRNLAAHGQWDQVADRDRVRLMLEGVNLFMRQKTV